MNSRLVKGSIISAFLAAILFGSVSLANAQSNPTTQAATGVTTSDATLNAMNGADDAQGHSFWVSTSTFDTSTPSIPANVYSTPDMGAITANTAFSTALSSLVSSGVPSNMPAITPNTTYYYAAWTSVSGTWYPGSIETVTTASTQDVIEEEFVTVDGSYKGISVGFRTIDIIDATAVTVTLTRADATTVVKTANQGVLDIINAGGTQQLTAPFVIQEGTFTEASDTLYWDPAPGVWDLSTTPTSVTIEVVTGSGTFTATNSTFNEGAPSWPTYESLLVVTSSASTTIVTESDLETETDRFVAALNNSGKWFFYNDETDTIDNSLGSFVSGPSIPPAGDDSVEMTVSGTQRRNLATYGFKDIKLAAIKTLEFSTYSQSAGNGSPASERSAYLQFNVDFANNDTWQRRLTYVPANNGVVVNDSWQTWDAINSGNAMWTYSGANWPAPLSGTGSTPKTWTEILAAFPDAETRSTDSYFGFRVGEPYADGFTGNVDKVVIGVQTDLNIHTTTYDFENQVSTVTTITNAAALSSSSAEAGANYQVQWSVSPATTSANTVTGTVTVNGSQGGSCTAVVEIGGCNLSSPNAGTETITATYSGDSNFGGSVSASVDRTITSGSSGGGGGGGGGGNGPIFGGSSGSVLGASIGPSGSSVQGQVLGASTSTTSTGGSSSFYTFTTNLTIGSRGADVVELQKILISLGYDIPALTTGGAAYGYFGTQTRAAVAAYQRAHGITPAVGFFGPITRAAMNSGVGMMTDAQKAAILASLLAQLQQLQAQLSAIQGQSN